MDVAAFKVSHSTVIDIDATALRAARARSSYIHRGNGTGAMEEMSQKVQNANTHRLRRQNHAHTRAATSQFKGQVKLEGVR